MQISKFDTNIYVWITYDMIYVLICLGLLENLLPFMTGANISWIALQILEGRKKRIIWQFGEVFVSAKRWQKLPQIWIAYL